MSSQTIKIDYLARVEGEGSVYVRLKDDRVQEVQLRILEPPRFFEGILRGRSFTEAPDITSRICGICPVAHQLTAAQAMEDALGLDVPAHVRDLRRLLYLGEWIESHALHVGLLHSPDFLGYQDAVAMAHDHPATVSMALRLKKLGNDVVAAIGGREIHPVNVRVGGFYRMPAAPDVAALAERLRAAADEAEAAVRWCGALPFPPFEQDHEFVALVEAERYAVAEGRIVSNRGIDLTAGGYEEAFVEEQVGHSSALHSTVRRRGAYVVGPLARYSLSYERLTPRARSAARAAGLAPICRNPFQSIIVRAVELLYACEEAHRLAAAYTPAEPAALAARPRAATGCSVTEAPRGLLFHRYSIDHDGLIRSARIVTPTAQNLLAMEGDLREFVPLHTGLHPDELIWQCEQAVRNYDPCISCATHFLRLDIHRE